jgi:hypothetical protein
MLRKNKKTDKFARNHGNKFILVVVSIDGMRQSFTRMKRELFVSSQNDYKSVQKKKKLLRILYFLINKNIGNYYYISYIQYILLETSYIVVSR